MKPEHHTRSEPRRPIRHLAGATGIALLAAAAFACSDSGPAGPGSGGGGDLLLITSIADASGADGSSFVQAVGLSVPQIGNSDAFEQTFRPYPVVYGTDAIVLQGGAGDRAVRYVRDSDGRLAEAGRLSLPPGSFAVGVAYASPAKAYISLLYAGKILVVDPQTMTVTGEIDLTGLGIARNPANPGDVNPEPGVMLVRDGKLFVGLQQLVTGFSSADGVDVAVIDVATDQFEKVIHDPRSAGPGNYGFSQSMFVDEHGDLYVYCVASFGFVAGQKSGLLRIRAGETEFDPDYFVDLEDAEVDVPGGRIALLSGVAYGGDGYLYAIAAVPALQSQPPNFATDRNFQPVRVHLASGEVEVLPLPRSNGIASGLTIRHGTAIFGLSATSGAGLYTYDLASREASAGPAVQTSGDPTHVLAFP